MISRAFAVDFNPRSPCGERPSFTSRRCCGWTFQSTLPVWGATSCYTILDHLFPISIHAPRVGSDFAGEIPLRHPDYFNPRSPCGERRCVRAAGHEGPEISIHAPRVGSDPKRPCSAASPTNFNPRSPCGERRQQTRSRPETSYFNPRSPCGERRRRRRNRGFIIAFQSTLPVWGATFPVLPNKPIGDISIHAPRVGSDSILAVTVCRSVYFNPRSPCGERQVAGGPTAVGGIISIHAPRVGSDSSRISKRKLANNFNPRSPCGERLALSSNSQASENFNPRSPCGERRTKLPDIQKSWIFQSTLPVWGATYQISKGVFTHEFQSTLPVWGATRRSQRAILWRYISIHAPRVGSDHIGNRTLITSVYFNPRSPCGERLPLTLCPV